MACFGIIHCIVYHYGQDSNKEGNLLSRSKAPNLAAGNVYVTRTGRSRGQMDNGCSGVKTRASMRCLDVRESLTSKWGHVIWCLGGNGDGDMAPQDMLGGNTSRDAVVRLLCICLCATA